MTSSVYAVACSPFHRNVFISGSTDTTLRVYSLLQVRLIYKYGYADPGINIDSVLSREYEDPGYVTIGYKYPGLRGYEYPGY